MTRRKRTCSWCETSYYVTIGVFCGAFLIVPYKTQGTDAVYLMSESCSSADDSCGPSSHRLTCGPEERLAVVEASHGFQSQEVFSQCRNAAAGGPCSLPRCCRYNSSTDCRQPFSAEELDMVRTECSYRNSCQIQTRRANNSDCSTDSMAPTSTYSFLSALCIPDSVIADPCSDVTVTGRLVSLFSPSSPSPNHCNCQLHLSPTPPNTTTTTTNNNNNSTDNKSDTTDGNIEINAYEVEGSGEGEKWWVRVVEAEGRVVVGYADGGKRVFPTMSVSTPVGSLPLSVELGVGGGTRTPRVWVGFTASNVSSSTLVLRCGANASLNSSSSDCAQCLTECTRDVTGTDETTTQSVVNNSETTTTASGASSGLNNPTIQNVTENPAEVNSKDTTTSSSKDDGGLDTTDIIVYAAIGLSALLFFSFTYVCVRKVRRKGCPKWCPPYCRDLECGRDVDKTTNDSSHDPTTATTTTQQTTTSTTTTTRDGNSSESSQDNHKPANGSITPVAAAAISTYGSSDSLPLSAAAFHQREFKRHRSLASMHRPSLDNIRESEEESQFPTHHKHSNIDLAEAFRILDQRLHHHHHPNSHHHHHSHVTGDLAEEEHDEHEEERPVVFHLGSNESSEHDLEQHADKD